MKETRDQADYFAHDARRSISDSLWLRAVERCQDSRKYAQRLLSYEDVDESEKLELRKIVEDLKSVASFIERNRFKANSPTGLPVDRTAPIDSLIDVLLKIDSRLRPNLLEDPDDD